MTWRASASSQLGLVSVAQLQADGVTDDRLRRMVERGEVQPFRRGVWLLAGAPSHPHQPLLAAALAVPDATVSHRAAANVWGWLDTSEPELTALPRRNPRLEGVIVHRRDNLAPSDVARFGVFARITSPSRTLIDLAGLQAVSDETLIEAVFDGLIADAPTRPRLVKDLSRLHQARVPGSARLRKLLDTELPTGRPPHRALEHRLRQIILASTLPRPEPNYVIRVHRQPIEVDQAWPHARLAVEADSRRWHSNKGDLLQDRNRDQLLATVGWQVVRFTTDQIMTTPDTVVKRIGRTLAQRTTATTSG